MIMSPRNRQSRILPRPAGRHALYSHSFIACDPQPGGAGLEVRVTLRRGVTVSGRIVGPDDQPVQDAWIIGRAVLGRVLGMAPLAG